MTSRRVTALIGAAIGATALGVLGLPSGNAAPAAAGPDPRPRWAMPDSSVHMDPAAVVGLTRSGKGARVVAVFARGGRPVVRVWNERTRSAAIDRVAAAQGNPTLVSIGTEVRQQYVEPDRGLRTSNDALRTQQWALDRLQAEAAWTRSRGSGVTVAVIDTGIAVHDDLQGAFVAGADFTSARGNGRNDGHGHGTHVAGVIAATPDNGFGIAGLAPDARLIPVKVLDDSGEGYSSWVANGIIWAADNGADIVSMSLGGGYDEAERIAVAYAISRGATVVAAGGNSRGEGSPTSYPAAFPGVIGVAATTSSDVYASYSNSGSYIDIAAPGSSIMSTLPTGYAAWSGTSMATPYVSASAALVLARARTMGVSVNVSDALIGSADDLGPVGRDADYGSGLVDPVGALDSVGSGAVTPEPPARVDAAGDSLAAATPMTGTADDFIDIPTDLDFWSTDVAAPGTLSITLGNLPADYDLYVYAADGTRIGSSINANQTPDSVTLPVSAGRYIIKIAPYRGAYDPAQAYHLTTQFTANEPVVPEPVVPEPVVPDPVVPDPVVPEPVIPDPDLAGDSLLAASPLGDSLASEDLINEAADLDFWSFTVGAVSRVDVVLTQVDINLDLAVLRTNGSVVARTNRTALGAETVSTWLMPGTYVVRVRAVAGAVSTLPYSLAVTQRPLGRDVLDQAGDTIARATPLNADGVDELIHTPSDRDNWSFVLDATTRIAVTLSNLPADYDLVLLRGDGRVIARSMRWGTTDEQLLVRLPAGRYVVRVISHPGVWSESDYRLSVAPVLFGQARSASGSTDTSLRYSSIRATDETAAPALTVDFSGTKGETRLVSGQLVSWKASTRMYVGAQLTCTSPNGAAIDGFVSGRNVWPGLAATPSYAQFLLSVNRTGAWHCDLRPFVCTPPQCDAGPDLGSVSFVGPADAPAATSYLTVSDALVPGSSARAMPPASMPAVAGGSLLVQGGSSATLSATMKSVPAGDFTISYVQSMTNCIVASAPAACAGARSIQTQAAATVTPTLVIRQSAANTQARCTVIRATAEQGARAAVISWQQHHGVLAIEVPDVRLSTAPGCLRTVTVEVGLRVARGNAMTFERLDNAAPAGAILAYASAPPASASAVVSSHM